MKLSTIIRNPTNQNRKYRWVGKLGMAVAAGTEVELENTAYPASCRNKAAMSGFAADLALGLVEVTLVTDLPVKQLGTTPVKARNLFEDRAKPVLPERDPEDFSVTVEPVKDISVLAEKLQTADAGEKLAVRDEDGKIKVNREQTPDSRKGGFSRLREDEKSADSAPARHLLTGKEGVRESDGPSEENIFKTGSRPSQVEQTSGKKRTGVVNEIRGRDGESKTPWNAEKIEQPESKAGGFSAEPMDTGSPDGRSMFKAADDDAPPAAPPAETSSDTPPATGRGRGRGRGKTAAADGDASAKTTRRGRRKKTTADTVSTPATAGDK